jgi:4-hydroxybenzoate polyprenyltransferase
MIGDIIMIVAGLAFISSFFPWLRYHDMRRQRDQIDRGEQNRTIIRGSDRAFPAVGYLIGALLVSVIFSVYLSIVIGLMLLSVILYWILYTRKKNESDLNE